MGGTLRVAVTATNVAGTARATSAADRVRRRDPAVRAHRAGRLRHAGGRRDPHRRPGHLERHAAHRVRLPVAALRRRRRELRDIAGATDPTYTAGADDVGATLRVVVTATNAGGSDSRDVGARRAPSPRPPPVNQAAPTISGTARDGARSTAAAGTWGGRRRSRSLTSGSAATRRRELRRHRRRDGRTYAQTAPTSAATLRVVVTATQRRRQRRRALGADDGGRPVAPRRTPRRRRFRHGARRRRRSRPPAAPGPARPIAYAYQWVRCDADGAGCADIAGATGAPTRRPRPTSATLCASSSPRRTPAGTVGDLRRDRRRRRRRAGRPHGAERRRHRPRRRHARRRPGRLGRHPADRVRLSVAALRRGRRRLRRHHGRDRPHLHGDGGRRRRHAPRRRHRAPTGAVRTRATSAPTGARRRERAREHRRAAAIEGAPRDGQTLTADPGTWGGTAPVVVRVPVAPLRRDRRRLPRHRRRDGRRLRRDPGRRRPRRARPRHRRATTAAPQTAASAPTPAVAAQAPQNTATPGVSGPVADGGTLTADAGDWTGTPDITFTYQWERCDAAGRRVRGDHGRDGPDLRPRTARRSATRSGSPSPRHNAGGTATATSATTAPVAPVAPRTSDGPTVDRRRRARARRSPPTPARGPARSRSRSPISGSAARDLRRHPRRRRHDVRHGRRGRRGHVRVVVTATNAAGTRERRVRPATGRSAPSRRRTPRRPTITGIAADGATLTAAQGTWSGTPPIDFGYRWQRCDTDGASCDAIPDAVEPTYRPTADDVGHTIARRRDRDEPRRPRDRVVGPDRHGAAAPAGEHRPAVGLRHGARRRDADRRHGRVDRHRAARVQLPLAALRRERRLPHHRRRDRRDVHRDVGGRPQHAAGRRHGDQRRRRGERRLAADRGRGGGPARQRDRAVDRRRRACRRAARRRSRRLDRHRPADVRVRVAALRRPRRVVRPDRGGDRRQLRADARRRGPHAAPRRDRVRPGRRRLEGHRADRRDRRRPPAVDAAGQHGRRRRSPATRARAPRSRSCSGPGPARPRSRGTSSGGAATRRATTASTSTAPTG